MPEEISDTPSEIQPKSYKDAFTRLNEIAKRLESPSTELEEGLLLYEEGMKISEWCQAYLNQAQGKLKILSRNRAGEIEIRGGRDE